VTWLVDTNVISEIRKGARCDPAVAAWWAGVEDRDLFLSVLSLGEIRRGIEALRPRAPGRAETLAMWLTDIAESFGERILDVDAAVAEAWGRLSGPRSLPTVDALLAATAQVHGLVLVTRNIADMGGLGVPVLNPFVSPAGDAGE
jgi:predicted nucleic acid-binding protein